MISPRRVLFVSFAAVVALLVAEPASGATRARAAQPCRVGDVSQSVKTDRSSYLVGSPVKLTITARNDSHRTCTPPGLVQVAVNDAAGTEVFHASISLRWKPNKTWTAGRTFTWTSEWDQRSCSSDTCTAAAPGSYRAHGGWDEFREGATQFTIAP
jgi:hypothetical protein